MYIIIESDSEYFLFSITKSCTNQVVFLFLSCILLQRYLNHLITWWIPHVGYIKGKDTSTLSSMLFIIPILTSLFY